jgi:hypothetical protein
MHIRRKDLKNRNILLRVPHNMGDEGLQSVHRLFSLNYTDLQSDVPILELDYPLCLYNKAPK